MKSDTCALRSIFLPVLVLVVASIPAMAQMEQTEAVNHPVVPQIASYAGLASDRAGDTVEMVFKIYSGAEGGDALWSETQRVSVGQDGKYSVMLGSATEGGLPQTVFAAGQARWLGVGIERARERERVLLSSVPYAMKSADAESLAGHAASDFVTQEQLTQLAAQSAQQGVAAPEVHPDGSGPVSGLGAPGLVPLWTGANTIGNSVIYQNGSFIGINYSDPLATLDVGGSMEVHGAATFPPLGLATAAHGQPSNSLNFNDSAWSTTTNAPVVQTWILSGGQANNDTANPGSNFHFNYQNGVGATISTVLSIAQTGVITFAPTQTFPGTITSVAGTSPVTATTTSGAVSLGLNTSALETTLSAIYPQLATTNAFAAGATFGGPVSASALGAGANAVTATGTSGAYGISASSDTGNAGAFGNAVASHATLFSENTASFDGSYIPVALNATATGTSSVGAYGTGQSAGLAGASSSGLGVWGISGSLSGLPTLTSTGVLGDAQNPASGNAGVLGFTGGSQSTSYTYAVGKFGIAGVWGDTTGNQLNANDFSAAVMGTTDASDGFGGAFIANSADTDALFGKNLNSGPGIYGESLGVGVTSGKGTGGIGVEGFTPSPAEGQAGVFGNAYQNSATYSTVAALGPVGFVAGVWGDTGEVNDGTGTYTAGVVGTGDDVTAGVFENNSGHPTLNVTNLNSSGPTGLFRTLMASTADGTCGFGGAGSLTCTGQVKSLATTADARKLETYSMQSPENWMEDFGSGELKLGVAVVKIEPAFSETVTADSSYHVFITPNGDAEALYVVNKTATSFEVRESKGGTSSLTFDYRIVAKRRGYEAQRLTDVTERFNTERARAMPPVGASVPHRPRPQMSSPGGPGTPATQGTPRTLPRTHQGPVQVGGSRTQATIQK
jgi:hypothetical protein